MCCMCFEAVLLTEWLRRVTGARSDSLRLLPLEVAMESTGQDDFTQAENGFPTITQEVRITCRLGHISDQIAASPSAIRWALETLTSYVLMLAEHAPTATPEALQRAAINAVSAVEITHNDASALNLISQIGNTLPAHHQPMDAISLWTRRRAYLRSREAKGWPQVLTDVSEGQLRMPVYIWLATNASPEQFRQLVTHRRAVASEDAYDDLLELNELEQITNQMHIAPRPDDLRDLLHL